MRFELLFFGKIPSGNKGFKPQFAWDFRKQMHDQLQNLWKIRPLNNEFRGWSEEPKNAKTGQGSAILERFDHKFITLIHEDAKLACSLNIHFYEPTGTLGVANDVIDVDNKLKKLFDVLQLPQTKKAINPDLLEPQYCLLSDDQLIWEVAVQRHRLLRKVNESNHFTRIEVQILPSTVTMSNIGLLGTFAN